MNINNEVSEIVYMNNKIVYAGIKIKYIEYLLFYKYTSQI